jgi:anti-sigma factor RsiW
MTMANRHPGPDIVPYLRGELGGAEHARLEAHLRACAECAGTAEDFRVVLGRLAASAPPPPELHWGRYRAELADKLEQRLARARERPARVARWRPVPLALSAALAGLLVFLAVQGVVREPRVTDLSMMEEAVLGRRLELLRQYSLLEQLDLLEDLDVIRNLDRLSTVQEG